MPKRRLEEDIDDKMLAAAVTIVAVGGIDAVTMLKVGLLCGVAENTVYTHFRTKENLLKAAFLRIDQRFDRIIDKIDLTKTPNIYDVYNVWNEAFEFMIRHADFTMYYTAYRHSTYYVPLSAEELNDRQTALYGYFLSGNPKLGKYKDVGYDLFWSFIIDTSLNFAEKITKGYLTDTVERRHFIFYLIFEGMFKEQLVTAFDKD